MEQNIIELKAVVKDDNELYITPITTLIADYLIFHTKDADAIATHDIRDAYELFSKILSVENIDSDYNKTNNVNAGTKSLQSAFSYALNFI